MPVITELFAFISEDGPDDEGVIGMQLPNGAWYPFIGANMARVKSLMPLADQIAATTGRPYKIAKFEMKEIIHRQIPKPKD